jgi:hypothetical protein
MPRTLKTIAVVGCAAALAIEWFVVSERIIAAVWNWYKFLGYGGSAGIDVGWRAQQMFYLLSAAFAAICFLVCRTSKNTKYGFIARWELRGFVTAVVVWTAVLASPLVAPFSTGR